jgi:MbtH protein
VSNPFDDESGVFAVLMNAVGQHSLWPQPIDVPDGWKVVHGPDSRPGCLAFIDESWKDIAPAQVP